MIAHNLKEIQSKLQETLQSDYTVPATNQCFSIPSELSLLLLLLLLQLPAQVLSVTQVILYIITAEGRTRLKASILFGRFVLTFLKCPFNRA